MGLLPIVKGCQVILIKSINCPDEVGHEFGVSEKYEDQLENGDQCNYCHRFDAAWILHDGWWACACQLMRIDGGRFTTEYTKVKNPKKVGA